MSPEFGGYSNIILMSLCSCPNLFMITGQPITDPTTSAGVTFPVNIVTGCEDDGDDTCLTNLKLETGFLLSG